MTDGEKFAAGIFLTVGVGLLILSIFDLGLAKALGIAFIPVALIIVLAM